MNSNRLLRLNASEARVEASLPLVSERETFNQSRRGYAGMAQPIQMRGAREETAKESEGDGCHDCSCERECLIGVRDVGMQRAPPSEGL